jgi:hypothetical protein
VNPGFGVRSVAFIGPAVTGNFVATHDLGTTPVAVLLFGSRQPSGLSGTPDPSIFHITGICDGATERSTSYALKDGASPSQTASSYKAKLVSGINESQTVVQEANFVSWSSTSITFNFTTVEAGQPWVYWMLVIGAAGLQAKVIEWTTPTAAGNKAVTGVGFSPQVVLHVGSRVTLASTRGDAVASLGVMISAAQQWALAAIGSSGVAPTSFSKLSGTDALLALRLTGATVYQASFVSMDVNGFTTNFSVADASALLVASLCLRGLSNVTTKDSGGIDKVVESAPRNKSYGGVGFQPAGLLFATHWGALGLQANFTPAFGGADVSGSVAIAAVETSDQSADKATSATSGSRCLLKPTTDETVIASASLFSMDANGFTLTWDKADPAPATIEFLAMLPNAGTLSTVGIPRNYYQAILGVSGAEKLLLATSKSLYVYNATTGVFDSTSELFTAPPSRRFGIANTQAIVAYSNGTDNIRSYDGTSFANLVLIGTNHAAKILLAFNNRIISVRPFFGGIDHKTQIRWSTNGGLTDWSGLGSGVLEIVETQNAPLTSGFVLGDRCYVARMREVIELIATGTTSPVFRTETRLSGIGVLATHSVAIGDQFVFWLGPDDVYVFDGSQVTAVGENFYHTIIATVDFTSQGASSLDQIQGAVNTVDSEYWLLVGNNVYIYDYRRNRWYRDTYQNVAAVATIRVGDQLQLNIGQSLFIAFGATNGRTYQLDNTGLAGFLGGPVDSFIETKDYTAQALTRRDPVASYDKYNSLWRVMFRGDPGEVVEVGASINKGISYPSTQVQLVTVNANGVGIAFYDLPFSTLRIRLRSNTLTGFSVQGPLEIDWTESGMMLPP